MIAVITAHLISTIVIEGIQCIPINKYLDRSTPGYCINIAAWFYCKPRRTDV